MPVPSKNVLPLPQRPALRGALCKEAAPVSETAFELKTADGTCSCCAYAPGCGPAPAVIFFMDGLGIRPDLRRMAERLPAHGVFLFLSHLLHLAGGTSR